MFAITYCCNHMLLQITYLLVKDNFVEFVKDFYKIVLKYLFGCFNNFSNQEIDVHDYTEVIIRVHQV